jgi:hypothetical protein
MKNNKLQVTDFFNDEFVDFASYSTIRMIGSAIDGMKNVHRKIFYTVLDKNIKTDKKLTQLNSIVAEYCLEGSTIINTDMGQITIQELAERYGEDEFIVPCVDENNNLTTGIAHHPRVTKEVNELIEVTLESGELFRCTPDHLFKVLRNDIYEWVPAEDIEEEDEILDI